MPRGPETIQKGILTREWGLVVGGRCVAQPSCPGCATDSQTDPRTGLCRLVSVARGEQQYFDPSGLPTAAEACKSNALMRCCKDLGIAGELWCVPRCEGGENRADADASYSAGTRRSSALSRRTLALRHGSSMSARVKSAKLPVASSRFSGPALTLCPLLGKSAGRRRAASSSTRSRRSTEGPIPISYMATCP